LSLIIAGKNEIEAALMPMEGTGCPGTGIHSRSVLERSSHESRSVCHRPGNGIDVDVVAGSFGQVPVSRSRQPETIRGKNQGKDSHGDRILIRGDVDSGGRILDGGRLVRESDGRVGHVEVVPFQKVNAEGYVLTGLSEKDVASAKSKKAQGEKKGHEFFHLHLLSSLSSSKEIFQLNKINPQKIEQYLCQVLK
jgi:hypothetical protein